jgi:nucleoside-diphosphate kinase
MVWQGDDVIALSRILIGKTNTLEALPGTIRGDFAVHTPFNLIHGSDSPESAQREIGNFFNQEEIIAYKQIVQEWI